MFVALCFQKQAGRFIMKTEQNLILLICVLNVLTDLMPKISLVTSQCRLPTNILSFMNYTLVSFLCM